MVVLALALSLGVHWNLLQSVAWIRMLVAYSQQADFREALAKTFGGDHPCQICKFVQDAKSAGKAPAVDP